MARLPQAADIRRVPSPAATPGIRVGAIDYGPEAQGARSIAEGVGSIAKAAGNFAGQLQTQADEVDDYATRKKLMDFKLQTEMELEQDRRSMPVGGEGYTTSWLSKFRERAADFVGERDANIPASQRAKVGLAIKQWETALVERAQREEYAENDRHTIAGLETTVTAYKSRVAADPNRYEETQGEIDRLIDLSPITPAQRDAYKKKVKQAVQEEAASAWADRATTAEGREAARNLLAPHMADKVSATVVDPKDVLTSANRFFLDKGLAPHQAAAIAGNMRWESGGKPDLVNPNDNVKNSPNSPHSIGIGQWNDRAPALVAFARAQGVEIPDGDLRSVAYARTVAKAIPLDVQLAFAWQEMQTTEKYAFDRIRNAPDLRSAAEGAISYHRPAGWTRNNPSAGHGFSNRVALAQNAYRSGAAGEGTPVDGGYMDAGVETYAGPFADLPLAKRRAIWARAETAFNTNVQQVQGAIKEQMKVSEKGVVPPEAWLEAIEPKIKALNHPETTALYATMLGKAQATAGLKALPPSTLAKHAEEVRARLVAEGGTKEQLTYAEHVEKLAKENAAKVKENAIGWAKDNRLVVPLNDGKPPADIEPGKRGQWEEMYRGAVDLVRQGKADEAMVRHPGMFKQVEFKALNFNAPDIDVQLDKRLSDAKGVSRYAEVPVQMFTPVEREALSQSLAKGGDSLLFTLGKITAAAERNGVDAASVLKEVSSKDAPELTMIGHLAGNSGDPGVVKTAAKAMAWRHGQGENFKSTIDRAQSKPTLGEYAEIFKVAPEFRDAAQSTINLIYEYEARAKGVENFDQGLYTEITHKVFGETKDRDGNTFGGIGYQGGAWFDGKSTSRVLVPPQVKQREFDNFLETIRADDLISMGGVPKDPRGNPYSMTEIRQMEWSSVNPMGGPPTPGIYALKVKDLPSGPLYAMDDAGRPIVIDVRPVMGDLQKRKPSIFMGYDGTAKDEPVSAQQYPSYMSQNQPATWAPQERGPAPRGKLANQMKPIEGFRE